LQATALPDTNPCTQPADDSLSNANQVYRGKPTLIATLRPDQFQSTIELNSSFLRPVRPGRITAKGRVVHRDGDLAFLDASLFDADGMTVATATATARVIPFGVSAP